MIGGTGRGEERRSAMSGGSTKVTPAWDIPRTSLPTVANSDQVAITVWGCLCMSLFTVLLYQLVLYTFNLTAKVLKA